MYVETVPNRNSPPAILLRESFREGNRVRKRTLANLSQWPKERVEALRMLLKGGALTPTGLKDAFSISRTLPHGHVAAVLGSLRKIGLDKIIAPRRSENRDLVVAMIVARIIDPGSKLATARGLGTETKLTSLADSLGLENATEDELYRAMDWLVDRQPEIEKALAAKHLSDNVFALYDLTSTYFEGRACSLAKLGHSRDHRKDKLQVVFGLLCDGDGCPVAVEVFPGNTGDPKTLKPQIDKLRDQFGLEHVVLIGDRGMITEARIRETLSPVEGYAWITALRAPAIRKLVDGGSLQLSLFDEKDLGEITSPDFPGERLVVCRNPLLAEERARKRLDLIAATEKELDKIATATKRKRSPLRGKAKIGMRVGKVLGRFKVGKHFDIVIENRSFQYCRNQNRIDSESALDGFYVVRTNVPEGVMDSEELVGAYKSLSSVERAFRSHKSVDLKVRPIFHRLEKRVRAHILLCMLAYYVEWHMRQRLAPILFDDEQKEAAQAKRKSMVAPAQRSTSAKKKAQRKRTPDDLPVQSFQSLIRDLATIAKNRIRPKLKESAEFDQLTALTPLQQRAFDLLGFSCRL